MIKQIINKLNNATDFSMDCFLDEAILWSDEYDRLDIPSHSFKELKSISFDIDKMLYEEEAGSYHKTSKRVWRRNFDNLRLTIMEFLIKNYTDELRSHDFDSFEAERVFEAWIETGSLSEYFSVVFPHLNRLNYNINKNFGSEEKSNNMREDLLVKYQ